MTEARWYSQPDGEGLTLQERPRLASWNKATDQEQVRLRQYLEETAQLLASSVRSEPWVLRLDVGLPTDRALIDTPDLDNYAFPLAARLRSPDLVSVWCTKGYANTSRVAVGPAEEAPPPANTFPVHTTASLEKRAYKEQVRSAVAHANEVATPAVRLQLAFVVGPQRNWLNLWKPTIDALDPLLGRTRADREWHPRDGRIVELGLHVTVDALLGHDVLIAIAASETVTR